MKDLSNCTICPRDCGVNRFSKKLGYCNSDASFRIAAICAHKGEEPVISGKKGICNVFFPHCNLQCVYCQNFEISGNESRNLPDPLTFDALIDKIISVLDKTENILGFVSPSHYIPQMLAIVRAVKKTGRKPTVVYNSNGYDKVQTLRSLEGVVDVYLPDFKYSDNSLARRYSKVNDYREVAAAALKEMYRQKGSALWLNERGMAESGLILRHLVLPGAVHQSIEVLRYIAREISPNLHISLMSQYYPAGRVKIDSELNRTLIQEEYNQVKSMVAELGFHRGWIQKLTSHQSYRPDFSEDLPFKK